MVVEIQGQTHFMRNGEAEMGHYERTVIAEAYVETHLAGIGDDCEPVEPVISTDPAVIDFERRKDEARRISAYRNRPIRSIFKETKPKRRGSPGH